MRQFALERNPDVGAREEAHSDQVPDLGEQETRTPQHSVLHNLGTAWRTTRQLDETEVLVIPHVIYLSPLPRLIGEEKLLSFPNSSEFLRNPSPLGIALPFTQLRQEPRAEMQLNIGLDCETSADRLQQGIACQLSKA